MRVWAKIVCQWLYTIILLPEVCQNYFFPWFKMQKKKKNNKGMIPKEKRNEKRRKSSFYKMILKCTAVAQISKLEILNNQASPVSSVCIASVHIAVTGEVPTHQLSVGDTCNDFTLVILLSIQIVLGLGILFIFSYFYEIHTVCSPITLSSTDCQELSLPLGTDPILFKPTGDLAGGWARARGWAGSCRGSSPESVSSYRDQRAEPVFAAAKQTWCWSQPF